MLTRVQVSWGCVMNLAMNLGRPIYRGQTESELMVRIYSHILAAYTHATQTTVHASHKHTDSAVKVREICRQHKRNQIQTRGAQTAYSRHTCRYHHNFRNPSSPLVVVVCLPRPMEGMGRLKFSDLFSQNCQFHHRRLESLKHLMCLIYILLSTTVSHFLDLTDAILFTRSPFFPFFLLLYTFPFLQVHFACVLCI